MTDSIDNIYAEIFEILNGLKSENLTGEQRKRISKIEKNVSLLQQIIFRGLRQGLSDRDAIYQLRLGLRGIRESIALLEASAKGAKKES